MGSIWRDIRYALRAFSRSPSFAAVAVAVLALGIGANTAIFSVLNALVLREVPVWTPERLVQLSGIYRNGASVPFSSPMFQEVGRGQRVFSSLFGWTGSAAFNVEVNGVLSLGDVRGVTESYYPGLGVAPLLGRLVGPEDIGGNTRSQVAVISYEFWERRFGGDPAVIGKPIRIEGCPFTIIGVTRKWFTGMTPGQPPEVTIPITAAPLVTGDVLATIDDRARLWLFVTGRLKDGITIEQAGAQLRSFWPGVLAATVPTERPGQRRQSFLAMGLDVQSAATGINVRLRSQFTRPLDVLLGIVGLILLIACVNLSNLMLARAATRGHEMSMRLALGATRLRIARQLVTESLVLSAAGALLALALAYWGSRFLVSLMTEGALAATALDLRPDWRVFSFTALVGVLTGVLIGLAPAWQVPPGEPASILRRNERALRGGTGNFSKTLIVSQIALSLVLLLGSGLLLRTFQSLRSSDPGFQKAAVLEVNLYPMPQGYSNLDRKAYLKQLIERIAGIPGVLSVCFSHLRIPAGEQGGWRETVALTGTDSSGNSGVMTTLAAVSPDFFRTLGIPLVRGRDFGWADDEQHPRVAIVDSNLARALLPSGDVIGQRIRFGVQPGFQELQIIGVARSARLADLRTPDTRVVYVPCLQHRRFSQQGNLFVRANNAGTFARTVANRVRSLGHEYASGTKTLEQMCDQALVRERATAMLSSFFAILALLLAGIGLFGLMSYTVNGRTREIGIRLALGSERGCILRMILRQTLLVTVVGVIVGLPCALTGARLVAPMLFGVSPHDAITLATASGALLAVAVVAGYLPARRAVRVDPAVALRHE